MSGRADKSIVAPAEAIARLKDGNSRYSIERRAELAKGQHPFAIVVSCSNALRSRVRVRAREATCREAVDTMLTVPRSFLFFSGRLCSQPCEGANVSRGENTRL